MRCFQNEEERTRNHGYTLELIQFRSDLSWNFLYKIYQQLNSLSADVLNSYCVEQFTNRLDRIIHRLVGGVSVQRLIDY